MNYKKEIVVSNTSPMITLVETLPDGNLLLKKLFEKILIPRVVIEELIEEKSVGALTKDRPRFYTCQQYLDFYNISDIIEMHDIDVDSAIPEIDILDKGEAVAISLAIREQLLLMIDEKKGIRVAKESGVKIERSAEQIIKAVKNGIITHEEAHDKLNLLRSTQRTGEKLHNQLMNQLESF